MSDFANFRAVYDELSDEVGQARYQFVADHLGNWFEHLDDTPAVLLIVTRLQSELNFTDWYKQQKSTVGSALPPDVSALATDLESLASRKAQHDRSSIAAA